MIAANIGSTIRVDQAANSAGDKFDHIFRKLNMETTELATLRYT
jgi:hypothetical protein